MNNASLAVVLVGVGLALGILYLIRRDHLYIRQGVFWILVAVASFVLGTSPYLIDALGALVGIAYPPTLFLLGAIVVLLVKALLADIALTRAQRDLRRLNQRIALMEAEHPGPGPSEPGAK